MIVHLGLIVSCIHSVVSTITTETVWGRNAIYKPHISDTTLRLSYVVKETVLDGFHNFSYRRLAVSCPAEMIAALDAIRGYGGQIIMRDILRLSGSKNEKTSDCVRKNLSRIQRAMYITESMLNWFVQLNNSGPGHLPYKTFWQLFQSIPAPGATTLPLRPEPNKLSTPAPVAHHWYSQYLMEYIGKPLSAMKLSVVPEEYVYTSRIEFKDTIIAPSARLLLKLIASERERMALVVRPQEYDILRNPTQVQNGRFSPEYNYEAASNVVPRDHETGHLFDFVDTAAAGFGDLGLLQDDDIEIYAGEDSDFHAYNLDAMDTL